AIIDSGFDIEHEDLQNVKISPYSRNLLGDGTHPESWMRDQKGHGTFVGSLIAAETGNGVGIASLADQAELMILRVVSTHCNRFPYDAACDSGSGTVAKVASAICYAADHGADVINISMGAADVSYSATLQSAVDYAKEQGIIVVVAAGNGGGSALYYPAACDGVIGVGAVDSYGIRWSFSQHNSSVDTVAPGHQVMGIDIYPNGAAYTEGTISSTYTEGSGTSYAAPIVSAFAALAKQVCPDLDHDGFLMLLAEGGEDKGIDGRDDYYGYGLLKGAALIEFLLEESRTADLQLYGGSLEEPFVYAIGSGSRIRLPIPVWEDHVFTGWYRDEALTDGPVETFDSLEFGELVQNEDFSYTAMGPAFYAGWEDYVPVYPVWFFLEDGAEIWQQLEVAEGDTLGTLPVPDGADSFTGWYTRPGRPLTRVTAATEVNGPLKLYACWSGDGPGEKLLYRGGAAASLLSRLADFWKALWDAIFG
ncbi:MAG: S8 family serine peptidase, partial [Firmicutes bacterium]|nr:S8 family serine peptidase [Bacillota bacterium]